MKLRIRGDSVRLRVSQTELRSVVEAGSVADSIEFGPESRLTYRLQAGAHAELTARLESDVLTVSVPHAVLARWAAPDEVAISGAQPIGEGRQLTILVEKDFACRAPRDEDESDLFPNPEADPC